MIFIVKGKIKGKKRTVPMGKGWSYNPAVNANYENWVKIMYQETTKEKFEGAIKMVITAYFHIPKSYTKKKKQENPFPIKVPDSDNIGKLIADSLNGIAYHDDKQIVEMTILKKWTQGDEFVEIELLSKIM